MYVLCNKLNLKSLKRLAIPFSLVYVLCKWEQETDVLGTRKDKKKANSFRLRPEHYYHYHNTSVVTFKRTRSSQRRDEPTLHISKWIPHAVKCEERVLNVRWEKYIHSILLSNSQSNGERKLYFILGGNIVS